MADHSNGAPVLGAPVRNRYFYGKLLDVRHFDMEQSYFIDKRWLTNRLGLGGGVLCGLGVTATQDGKLQIDPGVAVDGWGREVVVPAAYCLQNPAQPTDDLGQPSGQPLGDGDQVTVVLCYLECDAEPAPVLVGDCDTQNGCANSSTVERYRILVRAGLPDAEPAGLTDQQCQAIFPASQESGFDRRVAACETIDAGCDPPADPCLVLATVTLGSPLQVDTCTYRSRVYSNAMLFDMLLCLAARVDACCQGQAPPPPTITLRKVAGDAQTGAPGSVLPTALQVQVVDGGGNPVSGEPVTFAVQGGGGGVGDGTNFAASQQIQSATDGSASAQLQLGPAPGLNTVDASIASGSSVSFVEMAQEEAPPAKPPVVEAIWPPNAESINTNTPVEMERWRKLPRIEVTFDRAIADASLQNSPDWIRAWALTQTKARAGFVTTIHRLELGGAEIIDTPTLPVAGVTALFKINPRELARLARARFLVQMHSGGGVVVDTGTPPLDLDAEFKGTGVDAALLEEIWNMAVGADQQFPPDMWNGLTDTGAMPPSGDGNPGGMFASWFEVILD